MATSLQVTIIYKQKSCRNYWGKKVKINKLGKYGAFCKNWVKFYLSLEMHIKNFHIFDNAKKIGLKKLLNFSLIV